MRALLSNAAWLAALTINDPALAAESAAFTTTGVPSGFAEIAAPRVGLVDIYFGERKVGETLVVAGDGALRFQKPDEVLAMLPHVQRAPELEAALSGELATHSASVCSLSNAGQCGLLSPEIAGIIYDADRFRVDVFVNPKFLGAAEPQAGYLPVPDSPLSLISAFGATAAGTIGEQSIYNLQNRTIVGFRNARLRANTSVASHLGLIVDDLAAELDRKSLRFTGGLFWSPGNDFTGQRRIVGAGVGTQLDTWADREDVTGTPLILFLPQPSRVELLVDERLVGSGTYEAGNSSIDTSALPSGSYTVVLRIHASNGSVREERRFFVKNSQVPPAGHAQFYAFGGMLANTEPHRAISISQTFYYQLGAAKRLSNRTAADVTLLGTEHKAIVEAGSWWIAGPARFRAAALISTAGDYGGLLQASSAGGGPLTLSFDLRRIWSADGRPLIPLPTILNTFDAMPQTGVQLANGTYTQATASAGLRIGAGYVSLVGSYRKDRELPADYSIGPNVNWPVVTRNRLQVVLEASGQRTRTTTAAFAGVRLLYSAGRTSVLARGGRQSGSVHEGDGPSAARLVGSVSAQYSHESANRTLLNLEAGADRDLITSTVHGGGEIYSRFGNVRGHLLRDLGDRSTTQYDINLQSGLVLGTHAIRWGARDMEQSAIVVAVHGDSNVDFNVLVDEVARGRVRSGGRLSLYLPGYRSYQVRLVPAESSNVSFDGAAREITLYPGNVRSLDWSAESFFTIFAQALLPNGLPIADALVETHEGIAQTDAGGYFQVDVRQNDPITISKNQAALCQIRLPALAVKNDFASAGKLVCQ